MHKWGSRTNGPQGIWGSRDSGSQHVLVPGTNEALGHMTYMGFSTFGVLRTFTMPYYSINRDTQSKFITFQSYESESARYESPAFYSRSWLLITQHLQICEAQCRCRLDNFKKDKPILLLGLQYSSVFS